MVLYIKFESASDESAIISKQNFIVYIDLHRLIKQMDSID